MINERLGQVWSSIMTPAAPACANLDTTLDTDYTKKTKNVIVDVRVE